MSDPDRHGLRKNISRKDRDADHLRRITFVGRRMPASDQELALYIVAGGLRVDGSAVPEHHLLTLESGAASTLQAGDRAVTPDAAWRRTAARCALHQLEFCVVAQRIYRSGAGRLAQRKVCAGARGDGIDSPSLNEQVLRLLLAEKKIDPRQQFRRCGQVTQMNSLQFKHLFERRRRCGVDQVARRAYCCGRHFGQ